tara:strand:+ start:10169 stop:11317 length:1149 start_codon:yes stop_codon:yes gene_type:complete
MPFNKPFISEKDSTRFNMKIFRGSIDIIDVKSIRKNIIENNVDIGILRIKSASYPDLSKLNQLGFPYINADTLVYYHINIEKYKKKELRNKDLEFEIMNKNNFRILDDLVDEIFVEYSNHYFSNPYLDKKGILDGYKEWVREIIEDENNDKICYLARKNAEIAGFATVSIKDGVGEGLLNGVLPSFSGRGIYTDIIRYILNVFKEMGLKKMKISTQIQNCSVQKVWTREQFFLKESFVTIHINSFLTYSKIPVKHFDITFSEEDINEFSNMSGNLNPVHFDDIDAQQVGFNYKMANCLIANSILTKYYGVKYPGKGTFFLNYSFTFIAPIYPAKKYNVEISFYEIIEKSRIYKSLAKIRDDENGNLCLISYNTLKKKKLLIN